MSAHDWFVGALLPLMVASYADLHAASVARGGRVHRGARAMRVAAMRELSARADYVPQPSGAPGALQRAFDAFARRAAQLGADALERRDEATEELAAAERAATVAGCPQGVLELGDALALVERVRRVDDLRARVAAHEATRAFAAALASVNALVGLSPKHCANCGDEGKAAVECPTCTHVNCVDCLAEAASCMAATETSVKCFYHGCGQPLPRTLTAATLGRRSDTEMLAFAGKVVRGEERARALEERVALVASLKRRRAQTLGEAVVAIVSAEALTCPNCAAEVDMYDTDPHQAECMHMTCDHCSFLMCGFCHDKQVECPTAPGECNSYTCLLNPLPHADGGNVSEDKAKAVMVLRASRVADELRGASPAERQEALTFAAAAMKAAARPRVGELCPDDPWLFREWSDENTDPNSTRSYLTPVLRTVLHDRFRGASGDSLPLVVFRDVAVGDVVTLTGFMIGDEPVLATFVVDVLESRLERDADAAARAHAGRRGVVGSVFSDSLHVHMGAPGYEIMDVHWDAVVAHTTAARLMDTVPSCVAVPSTGDYALVRADAEDKCRAATLGWHPAQRALAGRWVLVTTKGAGTFTARLFYDTYMFPMTAVQDTVRFEAVLAAIS